MAMVSCVLGCQQPHTWDRATLSGRQAGRRVPCWCLAGNAGLLWPGTSAPFSTFPWEVSRAHRISSLLGKIVLCSGVPKKQHRSQVGGAGVWCSCMVSCEMWHSGTQTDGSLSPLQVPHPTHTGLLHLYCQSPPALLTAREGTPQGPSPAQLLHPH